ncbi:uncharacterized protein LOC126833944 [Adelges cooleyi]|uniref:uncharacterized protein LOC126833944 n=1 Tax=Adelges cooleyi TaxID=133065 RepID=UPI00217F7DA1|nr:uncharacterized protein LOC126833944 [Adelges cooleyi]
MMMIMFYLASNRKKMDFLYPCSLCTETFSLRIHIIKHIQTQHPNSLPKTFLNSESFYCSSCYKQFNNKSLLKKHIRLKHKALAFVVMLSSLYNISLSELKMWAKDQQSQIKSDECSWSLDDCLFLKELLPDRYDYRLIDYKKLLHGHFKAKFQVNDLSKTSFPNWLNILCTKTKVLYDVKSSQSNPQSNSYYKVFRCKCDNYWNLKTKSPFVNKTRCNSSLTVLIKNPNVNLNTQTKTVILMKHCHYHPFNWHNELNSVHCVYDELSTMLSQGSTAAAVMHKYKTQTLCNKSKRHFLNSAIFGTKPDAEFIFDLYYMYSNETIFVSPLAKCLNSLLEMVKYYNNVNSAECALVNLVDNAIVVTIRTPAMKQKSDTVFVCSTNCRNCITWFLLSLCDNGGTVP